MSFFRSGPKLARVLLLSLWAAISWHGVQATAAVPDYEGEFFSDLTGEVTSRNRVKISKALRNASQSSRVHIMLALINHMAEYPDMPQNIKDFAVKLGKEWEIGDQKTKKGLLILFSLGDKKWYAAKTKNLNQKVADDIKSAFSGRMLKFLKQGDIDKAMLTAASGIADSVPESVKSAPKKSQAPPVKTVTKKRVTRRYAGGRRGRRSRRSGGSMGSFFIIGIFIFIFLIIVIAGAFSGRGHGYGGGHGGGYYGGGGGGFMSGMVTGGLLGWMMSDRGGYGRGGYGGGDYVETTESWTETSGGGFDGGGSDFGGDDGGFDSFGGGDFDGGGSFGEW